MKITLAQAIDIRSAIKNLIKTLNSERNVVSTVSYNKKELAIYPERKIGDVEAELEVLRKDFIILDGLINKHNLDLNVEWEGEKISTYHAIELVQQIQAEMATVKSMGSRKQLDVQYSYSESSAITTECLYNVEEYRKKAEQLGKKARLLSQNIQAANHKVEFEYESANKYI